MLSGWREHTKSGLWANRRAVEVYPPHMVTVFDTVATVRSLEATGLERQQAEAIATTWPEAADVAEPVTQSVFEAALANPESKLTWRLIYIAGAIVAAVKIIPGPY